MPKPNPVTLYGKTFRSLRAAARFYDVSYSLVKNRVQKGMSIEQAFSTPAQKMFTGSIDYNGLHFENITEAAKHFGVDPKLAQERRRYGRTLDEIFGSEEIEWFNKPNKVFLDGLEFSNRAAACSYFGFEKKLIENRLRLGWTLEEAFELKDREEYDKEIHGSIYIIKCQANGKLYVGQTRRLLTNRWKQHIKNANSDKNVTIGSLPYYIRKYGERNFTIELYKKAKTSKELNRLEIELIYKLKTKIPIGMNVFRGGFTGMGRGIELEVSGKKFDSFQAACEFYDINIGSAQRRKELGWSNEEIFGIEDRDKWKNLGTATKINGYNFVSIREAIRHYDASESKVFYRMQSKGWTIEEALELVPPPKNAASNIQVTPYFNRKRYNSIEALADDYSVDSKKLRKLIKVERLPFIKALNLLGAGLEE